MAVQQGNGLAYKGDIQSFSVYELFVNGIVVLEAAIDNNDSDLKILIGKQGATFSQVQMGVEGQLTETKGRAVKNVHVIGGGNDTAPDAISEHIDGVSVQKYIYPRALRFVVELHLNYLSPSAQPAEAADEDTPKE
jgi:hypothetical protein